MKNVEIITSQNVVLQYELADLKDRIFAFLLDLGCLFGAFSILSIIVAAVFHSSGTAQNAGLLFLTCLCSVYSLVFEYFNKGQTIGKKALKIQVIKVAGTQVSFSDFAARWVFRLIDIYFSLGGIACLLIISSGKAQRIGDLIANTAVVKIQTKTNIDLDDLLSIHKTNKYIPKYQQARKLLEQDALLIKSTLERYRKFRNHAHQEAVEMLATLVRERLAIDGVEESDSAFLQTILQDYVVLSR